MLDSVTSTSKGTKTNKTIIYLLRLLQTVLRDDCVLSRLGNII